MIYFYSYLDITRVVVMSLDNDIIVKKSFELSKKF